MRNLKEYVPSEKDWYLYAEFDGPKAARTGFSLDGAGFLAGGSRLYRYDPGMDAWNLESGGPNGSHYISFVINGKAYVGALHSDGYWMYEYDPAYK